HLVHLPRTPPLDRDLHRLRMPPDDVFDLRWKEVDAADGEHVVDATADAAGQFQKWAAARTLLARRVDTVPGPVTDEWHAPSPQVGGHELALISRPAGRVEHLEDELRLDQMDAVALRAAVPGRAQL